MKKALILFLIMTSFFLIGCDKKEKEDEEETKVSTKEDQEEPIKEENIYYDDNYYDDNYKTDYWYYAKNIKVNKDDIEVYKKDGLAIYYAGMTEDKEVYQFWFKLINTTDYDVVDEFNSFAINDVSVYGGSNWKDVKAHSGEMTYIQADKYWVDYGHVAVVEEINFMYIIGKCNREDSCLLDYTEITSSSDNTIVIKDTDYIQSYETDKELVHEYNGFKLYVVGVDPKYPDEIKVLIENKTPYDLDFFSMDADNSCGVTMGTSYSVLSGDYAYANYYSYTKKIDDFPDGKVCFKVSYNSTKDGNAIRYDSDTIYYKTKK